MSDAPTPLPSRVPSHLDPKTPALDNGSAVETLHDSEKKLSGEIDIEAKADIEPAPAADGVDESRLVSGRKLVLIFAGFMLSVLLVSLDQTILATALPALVSEFNALNQATWIVSAYLLTQAGLMLTCGQLLTIWPTKWIYIGAIAIFELGSLFCGVAPSVNFLIFGRAVAGVGASGLFTSIMSIIAEISRLEQRPVLFGLFGAVAALASVIGPLLGGAFTDHVSWRWCFYINLPLGAVAIVVVLLFLPNHPPIQEEGSEAKSLTQRLFGVDWVGSILSLGVVTSLLLPLQWGGNEREWNDPVVIALFCVFGVLLPLFILWEGRRGQKAIMPLELFRNRTQIGSMLEAFFIMMALLNGTYYLPLFYQTTRGRTATESGIDILPFMLATVLSAALSGGVISAMGRYWPFLFSGPILGAIASGLFYAFVTIDISNATLIGLQIFFGIGVGFALQTVLLAIQAEYADQPKKVPQATSLVTFAQLMGGVLGIAIAGTLFANGVRMNLAIYAPSLPPELAAAVRQSVTAIYSLPAEAREPVIVAYVQALRQVFLIGVPAGGLAMFASILIRSWNIKERGVQPGGHAA